MKKYKILKLKSGEDLIGTVRVSRDGNIKIYRPMIFNSIVQPDIFGGVKEYFVLKDWLILSNDKLALITKESINTIITASPEVTHLYEMELVKQQNSALPKEKAKKIAPPMKNPFDFLDKHIQEMLEKVDKKYEDESNLKDLAKPKKDDKMVFMNMVFSPEVIVELLRSGILNRKEFGEIIDEITNENGEGMNPQKYTGDKKDKKDLGNKWTDWNADPSSEDYK